MKEVFNMQSGLIARLVAMLTRWLNPTAVLANSSCGALFTSILKASLVWPGKQSSIKRSTQIRKLGK